MRIQKEIENVERVKDKIATMPLTMEDAIEFHKQVVDRVEKERKEINKELDLDDDIEEKGFTGASKEPKKVSTPELKKMKLAESLFKSLNEGYRTIDEIYRDIESVLWDSDLKGKGINLQVESEDWINIDCHDEDREHVYDVLKAAGYDVDYDEYDDYVEIYVGDLYESLNEDKLLNSNIFTITDDQYDSILNIDDSISSFVLYVDKWGEKEIKPDNLLDVDEFSAFDADEFNNYLRKIKRDIENDYYSYAEIYDTTGEYLIWDSDDGFILNESLNECGKFKKGDCKNYALDEAKISRQNQRRKRDAYLQRKEAEKEKAEEEARKKERIGDAAWGEKDWIAEREKGDLDFSNYSDEEKAEIEKRLKAFDENPTAQAQYQRKKAEEERKKAEEERKKAEQEKEEKTKKNIERIGKLANAPKDIGNAFKKGLKNAGI